MKKMIFVIACLAVTLSLVLCGCTGATPGDNSNVSVGTVIDETKTPATGSAIPATEDPTDVTEEPTSATEDITDVTDPTGTTEDITGTTEDPTGATEDPTGTTEDPTGTTEDPTGTTENPTGTTENPTSDDTTGNTTTPDKTEEPHTHTYKSEKTTAATCDKDGVTTYTCTGCGHSYTEGIAKLGHNYTDKVTKPTCTQKGYTTHTCTRCNHSYTDKQTNTVAHSYRDTVTTAATCTKEGVKTFTCSGCGKSYTERIAKQGHSWGQWGVAKFANPVENGLEVRVCTACKTEETKTIAKVTGYTGNVFYNPNNTNPQQTGKVMINPYCVYWKDGNLYAQCFVINATGGNVRLNNVDSLLIKNGNVELAYDEDMPLDGSVLGSNQYAIWEFRFFGNAGEVANYGYDLSHLDFEFKVS